MCQVAHEQRATESSAHLSTVSHANARPLFMYICMCMSAQERQLVCSNLSASQVDHRSGYRCKTELQQRLMRPLQGLDCSAYCEWIDAAQGGCNDRLCLLYRQLCALLPRFGRLHLSRAAPQRLGAEQPTSRAESSKIHSSPVALQAPFSPAAASRVQTRRLLLIPKHSTSCETLSFCCHYALAPDTVSPVLIDEINWPRQ
jgi:hypothetical protein